MRRRLRSLSLLALFVPAPLAAAPVSQPSKPQIPASWPQTPIAPPAFPDDAALDRAAAPLPPALLDEPFAIGEALYDPARAAMAVTSLLARMSVPIGGAARAAPPARGEAPFRLEEGDVRALVEMARADAADDPSGEGGPFSFRDLHRALAPLLPGISAARLAELYAQAYAAHPDALVPQVLMGQPIEPEMRLSRVQLWLLLVDGFAPPVGTPRPGRPVPAAYALSGVSSWGVAALYLPLVPSPDPRLGLDDWTYLLSLLPMLAHRSPLVVKSAAAHEGHGGPGAPVTVEARVDRAAAPIFSPFSGLPILLPRSALAGNVDVRFDTDVLTDHGSWSAAPGAPVRADVVGTARVEYRPKSEAANGRGREASESAPVLARTSASALLAARYDLPPSLAGFVFGDLVGVGSLSVGWHAETIHVLVYNIFDVGFDLGLFGNAHRVGGDMAWGDLAKRDDGTWVGTFEAIADAWQQAHSVGGMECPGALSRAKQKLRVVGTPVSGFGPIHPASGYDWLLGRPDGGYLSLEFFPASPPRFERSDPCQVEIWCAATSSWFVPFNDAQWTIPHAGYGIALPREGSLRYLDMTTTNLFTGDSAWLVQVERPAL